MAGDLVPCVTVSVIDGPHAGKIVRHASPPTRYRFPIPPDFKIADTVAPNVSSASPSDLRFHVYLLQRVGRSFVYRYVGIDDGVDRPTFAEIGKQIQDAVNELHRTMLARFSVGPGRNVGPDFGLPEECGGLGLTAGSAGDGTIGLRVGWRWWLVRDGKLTGVVYKTPWPVSGPLEAQHMPEASSPHSDDEILPRLNCGCGIYGRETPSGVTSRYGSDAGYALGIAVGWGHVVEHTHGWRAQFARPLCMVRPKVKDPVLELVAKSYGVPYVTLTQAFKLAGEFA